MDDDISSDLAGRQPRCRFGPDRRLTLATAAFAVLALVAAVLTGDPAGRLMFAGAALLLAAYTIADLLFWPRLAADSDGLVVRSPFAWTSLPWADVEDVRADTRERLGLRSTTLEIDAGEQLIVLSRRALGADPARVADMVRAFDPR
ncbi:MAG: PH domain-containing protein [Jatrophihabitantaceae bacterium]